MSDLVDFEDLGLLDAGDLKAVLGQVPDDQVLAALLGTPIGFRQRLLTKLPSASALRLEAQINARGAVTTEMAYSAQRAVVDALCRLSRCGQIAFHDPADMMVA